MGQASPESTSRKRTTRRYSQEEREQILREFHQSGLSAYRFCQDRLLTRDTLLKWLAPDQKTLKRLQPLMQVFSKSRMQVPDNLPVQDELLIPEEVKIQPKLWKEIDRETLEQLDYQPGKFFKRRIIRPK